MFDKQVHILSLAKSSHLSGLLLHICQYPVAELIQKNLCSSILQDVVSLLSRKGGPVMAHNCPLGGCEVGAVGQRNYVLVSCIDASSLKTSLQHAVAKGELLHTIMIAVGARDGEGTSRQCTLVPQPANNA